MSDERDYIEELANEADMHREEEAELRCLSQNDQCRGAVESRPAPPHGDRWWPRCEYHDEQRWASYEGSLEQEAQSPLPPSWFDPSAAGERWDEDA